MFQALCYYYPQPDFTAPKWRHSKHLSGTFGLMTNVTMVSIPIRPLRDNHLAFFLATELNLLGSVGLAPTPHHHKMWGKMSASLAAQRRESPSPVTPSLLCLLPAPLHCHFSTSPSGLCRCPCTARFEAADACMSLLAETALRTAHGSCIEQAGCPNSKGKTNPFCTAMRSSPKSRFALLGEGRKSKKENTTRFQGFDQYLQPA